MGKTSAGILMYRLGKDEIEVLLVHPGGPLWARKDLGAWSIPKGEFEGEDALAAAQREFLEELGTPVEGEFIPLTPQKQKSGKTVLAWAVRGDLDTGSLASNRFEMEWPPKSGRVQSFPEVDQAEWFSVPAAMEKINPGQVPFIRELVKRLGAG